MNMPGGDPGDNKGANMTNAAAILSTLSDRALIALGERDDLAPAMVAALVTELRSRRERSARAALAAYYRDSVGGSVLADYRAGNVQVINA